MIGGLIHRCTVSRPLPAGTDAYGHPAAAGFGPQGHSLRCRFSPAGSGDGGRLLLAAEADLAVGDRVEDIADGAGRSVDRGPFAITALTSVMGRAGVAYRSAALRRVAREEMG